MNFQRSNRLDKSFRVFEILSHEIQDHVTGLYVETGVHGYFPEEVFHTRILHGKSAQTVPQVIQGEQGFASHFCRLVQRLYERTPQLDHFSEILLFESLGETE